MSIRNVKRAAVGAVAALIMACVVLPGIASAGSANSAHLTSPLGQTLGSPNQTFTWSAGTGVSAYWLYVGTNVGASNIYNSGSTTALTKTVTNLPANGSRISVRLWSLINGAWQYNDYSFAAAQPVIAQLTSPTQHAFLDSTDVDFQWNAVTSQAYWLYVGSTPGGSQYCNSYALSQPITDYDCPALPGDGSTVYVRLWTNVGSVSQPMWLYHDYAFTAKGAIIPVLADSTPGCTASTPVPNIDFAQSGNPTGVVVTAGTTGPGSNDLVVLNNYPLYIALEGAQCPSTSGDTITVYVRLNYQFGAIWYHDDYVYTWTAA